MNHISVTLELSKDLESKFDVFARSISRGIAVRARDELKKGYQQILDNYYNDGWSPRYYHRTEQLRTKSYVGILDAGHPYHAFGGISLAPERLHYKKMVASYSNERIIEDFHESMHGGWEESPTMYVWRDIVFLLERTATKLSTGKDFNDIVAKAKSESGL